MTNEKPENKISENRPQGYWSNIAVQDLIKQMTVYFHDLDDFGKGVDLALLLNKYRIYFEKDFTVEQLVLAIHKHCEKSTVIPKVADVKAIIDPTPPEISRAQYQQACDDYKRNGFNQFTDAYEIKVAYEKQEKNKQKNYKTEANDIQQIASKSVKRIE